MRLGPKTDEERAAEVLARPLAVRAEWELDWTDTWFYVRLLGGKWTAEFKKTEADAACMLARSGAKGWCTKYKFAKQKSLCSSRYGIEACNMVAREWASRAEYFFLLWYDDGCDEDFSYSDELLESYMPTMEWVEWATRQEIASEIWAAISDVENARPCNT